MGDQRIFYIHALRVFGIIDYDEYVNMETQICYAWHGVNRYWRTTYEQNNAR